MEYLNITSQICFTSKVTLWLRTVTLTFPVCELSALDWIKKCFLPVVPLLCGIFKWNFTDMFHIKGYILWQRTITLTFPVHELSALDWSEKNGFWPVVHLLYGISEYNFTDMLIIKGYILWLRIVTLTFPDCKLSTLDWSENLYLARRFFYYMEYLNETSQICWTSKVTYF